jgi:hypothetical protein
VFKEIKEAKPIYGDIRDAVDAEKSYKVGDYIRKGGRLLRATLSSIVLIFLGCVMVLGAMGILTFSARGGLSGLIVMGCIIYALWWLFSGGQSVGVIGTSGKAKQGAGQARYRGPGMFDRLKSWALWNTKMGDRLRADIARHINEVSRMIENGDIDRALKRALALGAEQAANENKRGHGPTSLPKARAALDMDLSGIEAPTSSILNDSSFVQMATQYRELAQKLSIDGDHRRAAFIYSELLKDVPSALSELEKLKAFEDAAKLATARKSPGHITARLWFLAGKKEIALALAKRYDSMEFIANIAEKTDPEFANFVRGHWIKDLIAAGDLSGAVTQSADRPNLRTLHAAVTKQAVLAGLLTEAPVLVAAVIALDWRPDALNDDFVGTAEGGLQGLETYLNKLVHGADQSDAPARHALISGLHDRAPKKQSAGDPFWIERAPSLTDAIIRATLAYDIDHPSASPLADLRRAAKNTGLTVLAEDLRHIVRARPKSPQQKRVFALPSPASAMSQHWTMIACVGNHHTLVGAEDGELTLLNANGKRLWTDQMTALVGIVPIGPGRLVILVQADGAEKKLTLLDTALHSYRELGRVALFAWHQAASASTWLVQTPNAVGALDMSALLADMTRFDFLWSITQTVPVIVLGFQMGQHRVQWVSQRINDGAPGLIEVWGLSFANEYLSVNIIDPAALDGKLVYQSQHLWTVANQFWPATQSVSPQWQPQYRALGSKPYDFEEEQRVTINNSTFFESLTDFAQVIPAPEHGACAINNQSSEVASVVMWQQKAQPFVILEGVKFIAQFTNSAGRKLALIDDHQRIIICDFEMTTVTTGLL